MRRRLATAAFVFTMGCLGTLTLTNAQLFAKIEASPRVYALNPCETKQFNAVVNGKKADVSWESSDPKVVTINEKGVAMGVSPGYAFIRALKGNKRSNPISLFVRDKNVTRKCTP
jgi:hypothetical protein